MFSVANTAQPTERNTAGGIAPQTGILFTSAATFAAASSPHSITFNTNGNVVSDWYMTFDTTLGGTALTTSVFTDAAVDPEDNAYTGTYSWTQAAADTYYCRLYYRYGTNSYKTLDQTIILT